MSDRRLVTDLGQLLSEDGKFGTIYADPPWRYDAPAWGRGAEFHYETMTVDDIAALPVRDLAADDAHLHLWTTNGFLFEAKAVIESWGFQYRSCFVWVKPEIGLGNYWRLAHEFLLLGVRGRARSFSDHSLRSWESFSRYRHSAKPEQIRHLIEKVSPTPRLEMFGRRLAPGWTTWGNEVELLPLFESGDAQVVRT